MRIAIAVGLTSPHDKAADKVFATLLPIAERCVAAGASLWLRAWPARTASDAWIVVAALLQRVPKLTAGVVATFPDATRVSDIEDLLVIDNQSDGRVELAFTPDTSQEAITEVCAALRGEALTRLDPEGVPQPFKTTPVPSHGSIPTFVAGTSAGAWRHVTDATQQVQVLDAGPRPSVEDVERLLRQAQPKR
jgi:hypothetical protein